MTGAASIFRVCLSLYQSALVTDARSSHPCHTNPLND
jgi:hypothetical protein